MNKVLVVAPHPDDETLGCGGALLRHKHEGDEVHWLIFTQIAQAMGFSSDKVKSRQLEINKVAECYNFKKVHLAGFQSMALDTYPKSELINLVSGVVMDIKPNIIYMPYRLDAHSDHAVVFDVVASCAKSFRYPSVKSLRVYETLSETEFGLYPEDNGFRPNLFVNISDFLAKKIEIMSIYEGEMAAHPFPRSKDAIRAQAVLRGAVAGCYAAEAFMVVREII